MLSGWYFAESNTEGSLLLFLPPPYFTEERLALQRAGNGEETNDEMVEDRISSGCVVVGESPG